MSAEQTIEERIEFYKVILVLVGGLGVGMIVAGVGATVGWYRQNGSLAPETDISSGLSRSDFEDLEVKLEQRKALVEPGQEIEYGRDIGKLEPFEKMTDLE